MANYSIKDLENFTGVKAHTIRIWEKRYNLVEPKRTCTNIRYYNDEDLKKLLSISILNRHGYKISNIVMLDDEDINEKILTLSQASKDTESNVESLVVAMIDLDENKFEKIFNTAVIKLGFEEAVLKIIFPFFEKVGILWQIGTINPSQEHFISNLIRQKLIVAIDGLMDEFDSNSKTFLLFLPENEYHELGLLFYYYLLKKNGHKVIYLGESVPLEGIVEISRVKKIDCLLTSFITALSEEDYQSYFEALSKNFADTKIYLTGLQANNIQLSLPSNYTIVKNAPELRKILFEGL